MRTAGLVVCLATLLVRPALAFPSADADAEAGPPPRLIHPAAALGLAGALGGGGLALGLMARDDLRRARATPSAAEARFRLDSARTASLTANALYGTAAAAAIYAAVVWLLPEHLTGLARLEGSF